MIQANELRIGNYVLDQDVKDVITGIDDSTRVSTENGFFPYTMIKQIKPIPLTEEWLLKFGFESVDYGTYFEVTPKILDTAITLSLEFDDKDCYYQIGSGDNWTASLPIKYVHQLQNIYFALTGEELTLNKE